MSLTEIEVFTHDECASISEEVLKLDPILVDRDGFYTLGAAAYLDDPKVYPAMANAFNTIISQAFAKMHDRVNGALCEHLGCSVGYMSSGLGLPSFHVFD